MSAQPPLVWKEFNDLVRSLPPSSRQQVEAELDRILAEDARTTRWRPLLNPDDPLAPTPQQLAYDSPADIVLYGGSAGGGKTDLLCGLPITRHTRSIIFRREYKQLSAIQERITQILGTDAGYNSQLSRFLTPDGRLIRLGGLQHLGDEKSFQGIPFSLMEFDEVTEILESQFRFLLTWNRTTKADERVRVLCASNPPTTAEGEWIVKFWAPWLDPDYPNPAKPGELRWFVMRGNTDIEVAGPGEYDDGSGSGEMIQARSRTFIPSNVEDNPYLMATGYKAQLQALPEPLRSRMLKGSFHAGKQDHPMQVIPTEWVDLAQKRWQETHRHYAGRPPSAKSMMAMGVDVAQGGEAETVLSPLYGENWFDTQICVPGRETPHGPEIAGLVVQHVRDQAQVNIDVGGGWGADAYGHMKEAQMRCVAMNGVKVSYGHDRSGKLKFKNKRAEWWWTMREALDPDHGAQLCLPPDRQLRADLCSARWKLMPGGVIQIELKAEIIKRLGRSPDRGEAAIYAYGVDVQSAQVSAGGLPPQTGKNYNPLHRLKRNRR